MRREYELVVTETRTATYAVSMDFNMQPDQVQEYLKDKDIRSLMQFTRFADLSGPPFLNPGAAAIGQIEERSDRVDHKDIELRLKK
jgi:hypothetical protein